MHILIDGNSITSSRAGIGNYTYQLIKQLDSLQQPDLELTVAIRKRAEKSALSWYASPAIVEIDERSFNRFLPYIPNWLNGYDLYHEPNYIPRNFPGPIVSTVHDLSVLLYPRYHPLRRVAMFKLFMGRIRQATQIITDSENSKHQINELMRIPLERISVVYLGADEQFKPIVVDKVKQQELMKRYNLPERFFLYIGTLEPRKNLVRLIEAFSIVKRERPNENIGLVLAGGKGWLYEDIFTRAKDLKLVNQVIFPGYIHNEDLPYLYNMSLAFVYPSLYEGFGLPPLEAMACGIPVICSRGSSIPEVVGDAGLLVDPLRVEELSEAILRVLDSSSLREQLSRQGQGRAKLFSWQRCAQETLSVYKNCLES